MTFSPRTEELRFFSGTLLFCAGCFCVDVFSFLKQFLLFSVRFVFRSTILFNRTLVLRVRSTITSPSPSRTGFFCISGGVPCLTIDFRLFRALVPDPLRRLCFVLRRDFLCLPMDFLLLHAVVPGLLPPPLFRSAHRFHCIHAHIPLFPEIYFFGFTFVSCAISFHFAAYIPLSYSSLPFVVDLLQTIGCE